MAELVVGLENDQKILIPTSSEARSGNPLGTILAIHSNVVPYGYLPCNGVAFDENQYPALYALLGDNHTPVEGHTPDWNNAESITLSTSDYVVQKNGWLVGFGIPSADGEVSIIVNDILVSRGGLWTGHYTDRCVIQIKVNKGDVVKSSSNFSTQNFHLVPYKYYKVIKATSGLEETQQDYVLQSLLEADSYSTEEVATGKKWIDGETIYRRVFICSTGRTLSANGWSNLTGYFTGLDTNFTDSISKIIGGKILHTTSAGMYVGQSYWISKNGNTHNIEINSVGMADAIATGDELTLEYTKAD